MFDESFFVAAAFFTVIGAFIYLKLPSKLMQALDDKSAEIAKELADAKALRAEAQAEQMIADAKASAERMAAESREAMQAAMERRTKQAEDKIARAQEGLEKEVRAAITSLAVDAAAHLVADGMTDETAQKLVDNNISELAERLN
jgi:F-type H+-transporting ATPase subunit b